MAVFGVGGIGLNCVQGGVLAGRVAIIAVDVNAAEARAREAFGATHVIDASKEDTLDDGARSDQRRRRLHVRVRRQPGRHPDQALDAVAPGGTLTIVGVPKLGSTFEFVVHSALQQQGASSAAATARRGRGSDFPMLADLYLAGRLKIDELITEHYPLDDFQIAHSHDLQEGRLARGVFQVGQRTEETHMGKFGNPRDRRRRPRRRPAELAGAAPDASSSPSGRSGRRASRSTSRIFPASASRRRRARPSSTAGDRAGHDRPEGAPRGHGSRGHRPDRHVPRRRRRGVGRARPRASPSRSAGR